jgi:hypothetical protein
MKVIESNEDKPRAYKISEKLTDRVVCAIASRFKGVKLTKRAALEVALSEWLSEVTK